MIDRISLVHEGEERYVCPRNSNMHCEALEGVPVGAVLAAEIDGIGETLMSPFRGKVDVSISPEDGTCLHGNDRRTIPKSTFVNLPTNRRHHNSKDDVRTIEEQGVYSVRGLSQQRAEEIVYAVRMGLGKTASGSLKNPFRRGDKIETAEMLAILADHKSAGIHTGTKWLSNFQTKESAMSAYPTGMHLDDGKLAGLDAEWYRKAIKEAVTRLLAKK
ncbi:MAG: hypothetical protein NTZ25_01905 [Candidatus Peregrinibacteria bacterium]|nr:hypothetical protein [Candidatus Peregrinibacteria bacterium]